MDANFDYLWNSQTNEGKPCLTAPSSVVAVLGGQWGDEGKGKFVGLLASTADVCCRFNGGANAGHTLVTDGVRYALHLVPCGILSKKTINLLGNGVVIHLKTLFEELDLLKNNVPDAFDRLLISSRAHLLFDFHQKLDACQETQKSQLGIAIGTTKRGIGPCYASKSSRTGIRVADLMTSDWTTFETKYYRLLHDSQAVSQFDHSAIEELNRHKEYAAILRSHVVDGVSWLHHQRQTGKRILVEGANASLLDVDFGTYPCVTSSSTTAGGICTGLGLPPQSISSIIGVVKAYTTRVGLGPFLTELLDTNCDILRKRGAEFGTTTGRPRRCGWFDCPVVKFSIAINGITAINLTKLDVLSGFKDIKICVKYQHQLTGEDLNDLELPPTLEAHELYRPIYEVLPGWNEDLMQCTEFKQLPQAAQQYIRRIETLIGCPIVWVGVGPDSKHTLTIPK